MCSGSSTEGEYKPTASGLCVFISRFKRPFFHARQQCLSRGGDLLKLDNVTKHENIEEVLNGIKSEDVYTWVGVTRREYIWRNGKDVLIMSYLNESSGYS